MSFFRRNGHESEPERPQLPAPVIEAEVDEGPPPPPEDPDAEYIWRCRRCGSMGTAHESMVAHIAEHRRCEPDDIREYVPRPPASTSQEISASGIWIVVKMRENAEEGSSPLDRYNGEGMSSNVVEAATGLAAIQEWYTEQVSRLRADSTERDREEANGRYVAIDFFTGHRAEALVTSEWRANVDVAAGSHT